MVSPTAAYVDATGIHAPSYSAILTYLQSQYKLIYGNDAYLDNDSQDLQILAVFALAISDANNTAFAAYNAFSPNTAQGVGLSSNVKINGIARLVPTAGTVDVLIVGEVGVTINSGIVTDINNNRWFLPSTVTIPISGQITVTATAEFLGLVVAPSGTVTGIATPTRGWQSVTNLTNAAPGEPVERDGPLRQRQAISTMLPSQTVVDGIIGDVASIADVTRSIVYSNSTNTADANGIPAHALCLVVEGGNQALIAATIARKKTIGAPTYGTTAVTVTDLRGGTSVINFYRPTSVPINVVIHLSPLNGYTTLDGDAAVAAVIAFIAAIPIGGDIIVTSLYGPAYSPNTDTYTITSILVSRTGAVGAANVIIAFNEAATSNIGIASWVTP